METLSKATVLPLFDWRPPWPEPMAKAVVPETTRTPLIHRLRVTGPGPLASNFAVNQVLAAMAALPVATVLKAAPGLFQ